MKNDENGQLSCGIYSSPATARSPLQGWVGDSLINGRNKTEDHEASGASLGKAYSY